MSKNDYLPSNVLEFQQLIHSVRAQVNQHLNRWDISIGAVQALDQPISIFDTAVAVSENPETRTSAAILRRNLARRSLEEVIRPFIQGKLIHNPLVLPDDLRAMGLPVHDLRASPSRIPVNAPFLTAIASLPSVVDVRFSGRTGRRRPKGVRSCEICFIVSDSPNPPLDWDQLGHAEFATRSPVRFTFSGTQRGMWLHIAARWVSTRGEKGPWCEIISLVIA